MIPRNLRYTYCNKLKKRTQEYEMQMKNLLNEVSEILQELSITIKEV